jgi:hypothetical protein
MGLSAELHQYAADLAFKNGDPLVGFARFEESACDCIDENDYIVILQILSYSQGPADVRQVVDFLEKCLMSEFEEARNFAAFFAVPRFIKKNNLAKDRLLPHLAQMAEADISANIRRSASAALFLLGEISEESFHRKAHQGQVSDELNVNSGTGQVHRDGKHLNP